MSNLLFFLDGQTYPWTKNLDV